MQGLSLAEWEREGERQGGEGETRGTCLAGEAWSAAPDSGSVLIFPWLHAVAASSCACWHVPFFSMCRVHASARQLTPALPRPPCQPPHTSACLPACLPTACLPACLPAPRLDSLPGAFPPSSPLPPIAVWLINYRHFLSWKSFPGSWIPDPSTLQFSVAKATFYFKASGGWVASWCYTAHVPQPASRSRPASLNPFPAQDGAPLPPPPIANFCCSALPPRR